MFRRLSAVLVGAAAIVVLTAGVASAHVTVDPSSVPKGGSATFTFRVPNEEADASTDKIQVAFPDPTVAPLAVADVEPHAGWSYTVDKTHLAAPVQSDDGPVSDVVTGVTWTANSPDDAIKPGEFDEFKLSVDPLPTTVDSLTFKVLQTYSDGDVVRWIEATPPGGPEPEHPAPVVTLTAAVSDSSDTAAAAPAVSQSDVDQARTLGIVGIVVGSVGLVVGVTALVLSRRRRAGDGEA
jgi:uncharacterized protein